MTPSPESMTVPVSVLSPTCLDVHDAARASTAWWGRGEGSVWDVGGEGVCGDGGEGVCAGREVRECVRGGR